MARDGKAASGDQNLPEWGTNSRGTSNQSAVTKNEKPRRKRRWLRRVVIVGVVLLLLLAVLIGLAPMIGSSLAPGIIEGATKGQIAGSVKVQRVDLSWNGTQTIGPIELLDDKSNKVGTVSATIPVGLLKVVTEQWWSKANIDVGQIEITGDMKVVVEAGANGKSNLDRAIAPGPLAKPATKKPSGGGGGGGGPDTIAGTLKLNNLNIEYVDKSAPAGSPMAAGVGLQKFGGDIKFSYDQPGGANNTAGMTAKGKLAGLLKGGDPTKDKVELNADVDVRQSKSGGLENVKALVELFGAPIDLVDGLAGFRGELAKSLGNRAELRVSADGNLDKLVASLAAKAEGANVDMAYSLADGMLVLSKPGVISIRRTDFIGGMPSLQAKFAELGKTVKLDAGPSLDITVNTLKVPLPKEMLGGGAANAPKPAFTDLDLRAASIDVTMTVGKQTGSVALEAIQGGGAGGKDVAGAGGGAAGVGGAAKMTPFQVEPLVVTVSAPALSGPVQIRGGTKATLENKPAGDLAIAASASGLLDDKGRLKPDAMKDLRAQLDLKGTSTALLQPVASMMNLPLEMAQDVGPTLDLAVTATSQGLGAGAGGAGAGGANSGGSMPPMDVTFKLASSNINADAAVKIAETVTTSGEGISLRVGSAGPLVQRFLAAGKKTGAGAGANGAAASSGGMEVSGRGKIDVSIKDLSLDMNVLMPKTAAGEKPKPLAIDQIIQTTTARADVRIEDLSITMRPDATGGTAGAGGAGGAPKGLLAPGQVAPAPMATPAPIVLSRASLSAVLKPGEQPRVTLDSSLSHEGAPFTVNASASAPASVLGKQGDAKTNANPIEQLIAFKPTVKVDVKGLPRSITAVAPSLAAALDAGTAKDTSAEVKRMLASLLGERLDISVESAPDAGGAAGGGAQTAKVNVRSAGGTVAVVDATLKPAEAMIKQVMVEANVTPGNTAGLLAALSAPAEATPGASGAAQGTPQSSPPTAPPTPSPAKAPMALAEAFTLRFAVDPYTLPLETAKEGGIAPKWDAAPELNATISTSGPVTIRNVSVSESNVAASVRGLNVAARVPLAKIMGSVKDNNAVAPTKIVGELVRVDSGRSDPVAKLDVDAQVPLGSTANLSAVAKLMDVNTAAADSILGKPNYLVGALGDRIQANVRVQQVAAGNAGGNAAAGKDAPKRTDIQAELESARLKGASIRASMDDQAIRADSAKLTWTPSVEWVNDNLFGAAEARKTNTAPGATLAQETSFTLDLKKLAIATSKKDGEKTVQGPMKPGVFALDTALTSPGMTLRRPDGKTVRLDDIRATLTSRDAPGSIGFDVNIAKVSGDGADGSKASRITGSIDKLADTAGVITSDTAELTADGSMENLPTALVDALANQKGTIVDALGSILNMNLKAQRLSKKGGTIELVTTAPRVNAKVIGKIENDTFIQTGPMEANITEIIAPLVGRFAGGVPMVENVIKTPQDEKGYIKAENFTFPADGKDMTKFNGLITVDLGTAQFEAQGFFAKLLKFAGAKQAGVVGRKIEPFTVKANKGVLTYERFKFPLGEFTVETRGTVDLVSRRVDLVTYVPLLALADETVGLLGTGGLLANIKVLDRNTLVPIKVSGPMDKPKAEPDAALFLKENAARLIPDPKKILENPGKAIEDLLKGPKKDK